MSVPELHDLILVGEPAPPARWGPELSGDAAICSLRPPVAPDTPKLPQSWVAYSMQVAWTPLDPSVGSERDLFLGGASSVTPLGLCFLFWEMKIKLSVWNNCRMKQCT